VDILEQYKNEDGTYTSPKNGKTYKSLKAFRAHWFYAGHTDPDSLKKRVGKSNCRYCNKKLSNSVLSRHEDACYLNPKNLTECVVCGSPIKDYKNSKGTCSHSCSNSYFIRWKPENHTNYKTICFNNHKKECVVCGEDKIVAVHHNDHDHNNNDPMNLIPLCPTHHQYVHSRYKDEVQPIIDEYIKEKFNGD